MPTDDLVEAARSGHRPAIEALVTACLPMVYTVVARAADPDLDVDDVVQETMLRLVADLPGLRDVGTVRSWVLTIALRQVSEARRRAGSHRVRYPVQLPELLERPDPAAEFVDLTMLQQSLSQERREVAEAAGWLDPGFRALLSLWWLEQAGRLHRAELAAILAEEPRHLAVRVQRMRAQLDTARAVVRAVAAVSDCAELGAVLTDWDAQPSPLWRKRIHRHVRHCRVCSERSRRLVPAERLLTGIGFLPVPAALRARSTSWTSSGSAGSPVVGTPAGGTRWLPAGTVKVAAAVLAGIAVVTAGVVVLTGRQSDDDGPAVVVATAGQASTHPVTPVAPSHTVPSPAASRTPHPTSTVLDPSTFTTALPALPTVRSMTQLGPIRQNARVDGRDGGQSTRYGNRSVWIFSDTTLKGPWGFLSNSGAATTDLSASNGITLTSSNPASVMAGPDPVQIVPLTPSEKAFQQAHANDKGCTAAADPYCGVIFGFWPGPVVADPARDRVLFTYGKLCRGGAAGTPCAGVKNLGVGIAAVDMTTGTVTRLTATHRSPVNSIEGADKTLFFADGDGFTAAALVVGSQLYVYGRCDYGCRVARVPLARVNDHSAWRVYAGDDGWSSDLSSGVRLTAPGGAGQTVFYSAALKAYVNVYMPYGTTKVMYQVGGSPFGPWSKGAMVGQTEPGKTGTSGIDYSLYAHSEYAQDNGLVQYLSYFRPADGTQRLLRLVFSRPL